MAKIILQFTVIFHEALVNFTDDLHGKGRKMKDERTLKKTGGKKNRDNKTTLKKKGKK